MSELHSVPGERGEAETDSQATVPPAVSCVAAPAVTIGIPVFNGEAFLEDAIRSALGQTWSDLEVVISDNASTDRTAQICSDYAAQDARVRYFRHPSNLGAAPNYNSVFAQARGRYFKWLAHDDRILPSYVDKTVRVLEARSDAILCNSVVAYIDHTGSQIGLYNSQLGTANSPSPSVRLAWMILRSHSCVDFFGMFRTSALAGSLLHGSFHGADRALLAQMALRGPLVQIPAPLVQMREHDNRYTRAQGRAVDRAAWHDARLKGQVNFPTWRLYLEYLKMVRREPMSPQERARCYAVLARWWGRNYNAARAAVDIVALLAPEAPAIAERLKVKLFGAAPGHLGSRRHYVKQS